LSDHPFVRRPAVVEVAYGMAWSVDPAFELRFGKEELRKVVILNDRHKRNFETVRFFTELILRAIQNAACGANTAIGRAFSPQCSNRQPTQALDLGWYGMGL
jgi:hypothetical protein